MGTPLLWIAFNLAVVALLALDLGLFHRRAHVVTLREAVVWSAAWIVISLSFGAWIWRHYGAGPGLEFFTGYVIEKSLSVDNLFVFAVLFRYFAVEPRYQHRVLYWGIVGALLMRGAMIGIGAALIREFHWVLYGFGILLISAGVKMMLRKERPVKLEKNRTIEWARKYLPLTDGYAGQKFFVHREGIWRATPLVLVLLVMETTDLTFAIDSIPAVFSITRDPFIVYTSNVCAILGLRALYFLLAGALPYFRYLDRGLSIVLLFIGGKMLVEPWLKIPTYAALLAVGAILGIAAAASLARARVVPLVAPTKNPAEPTAKTESES